MARFILFRFILGSIYKTGILVSQSIKIGKKEHPRTLDFKLVVSIVRKVN